MKIEQDRSVGCPYCGEDVGIVVDCTVRTQNFIEDCQVCCRPIQFSVRIDDDGEIASIDAKSEDE